MALIGRLMDEGLPDPRSVLGAEAPEVIVSLIADLIHREPGSRLKHRDDLLARVQAARSALGA